MSSEGSLNWEQPIKPSSHLSELGLWLDCLIHYPTSVNDSQILYPIYPCTLVLTPWQHFRLILSVFYPPLLGLVRSACQLWTYYARVQKSSRCQLEGLLPFLCGSWTLGGQLEQVSLFKSPFSWLIDEATSQYLWFWLYFYQWYLVLYLWRIYDVFYLKCNYLISSDQAFPPPSSILFVRFLMFLSRVCVLVCVPLRPWVFWVLCHAGNSCHFIYTSLSRARWILYSKSGLLSFGSPGGGECV